MRGGLRHDIPFHLAGEVTYLVRAKSPLDADVLLPAHIRAEIQLSGVIRFELT